MATALVVALLAPSTPRAEISYAQELKSKAFQQLSEGIETYRKGDAKRAIDILLQVTTRALNSFRAFYYLGLSYKADRQYTKAIDILSFAIELDPTHLQAHVDLGEAYLKRGDTDEALVEYHRALSIQQGYAPAWDGLGRVAEAVGDDEKAVEDFKKAIELNPGFPDASLNLGDLYLRKDRLRDAADLFLKAIAVRPDFAAAYNRLGVAYSRQRLANEAIAALRKAAELEKGNPWHPFTIGQIEMDLGDLSQATRDFDAAIALDANYLEAYAAKARLLRRLGDFQTAVSLLDEALQRPSEDEKLKRDIAELRDQMTAEGQAHRDLTAKASSGTATPDDLRKLAGLQASMGDFVGAAATFAPVAPEADGAQTPASDLFKLGYYSLRAGSYEKAEAAFAKLREARPSSIPTLLNLALSLQGQGKSASAMLVLEEAKRLAPDDVKVLLALGNAQVQSGLFEEASASFRLALEKAGDFPGRARVETILKSLAARAPGLPSPSGGIR
jgi:tetratricopeptide (TPR) repeat protein